MDWTALVPLGLVLGGLVLGARAVGQARERARQRQQALRDWASSNGFQLAIDPEPEVRWRVSGTEEVSFRLDVCHRQGSNNQPNTVWHSPELGVQQLELVILGKALHDFFQGRLGKMLVNLAGGQLTTGGTARERALERLAAAARFETVPAPLGSGRFVAVAREPERWVELLSRELVAQLEAWPDSREPFAVPAAFVDADGISVETARLLDTPEQLHHLIRIGAALARARRAEMG